MGVSIPIYNIHICIHNIHVQQYITLTALYCTVIVHRKLSFLTNGLYLVSHLVKVQYITCYVKATIESFIFGCRSASER